MTPIPMPRTMADDRYDIYDLSLEKVRNRQEVRVIESMRRLLPTAPDFCGCRICVEDVYALALNVLPAHYIQSGSMVLRREPPTDQDVERAVADALDKVRVRPNHPDTEQED